MLLNWFDIAWIALATLTFTLWMWNLCKKAKKRQEKEQMKLNLNRYLDHVYTPTAIIARPEAKHPLDSVPYPIVPREKK